MKAAKLGTVLQVRVTVSADQRCRLELLAAELQKYDEFSATYTAVEIESAPFGEAVLTWAK